MYLLQRLCEPSTWAALAAVGAAFGLRPELAHAVEGLGVVVAASLAVLLPEAGQGAQ